MEWHNNSVPRYIPGGWEGCKQEQGRIYSGETRKSLDVVQLLSCVWLFAPPWTAAHQASLSFTVSWSLLKLMSWSQWSHPNISSSVIPFSFCPQSSPASGSFLLSWLFTSGGQSIGASTSASVLPVLTSFRIDWFDLLAIQGALKNLLQNHSSKERTLSILPGIHSWLNVRPWT